MAPGRSAALKLLGRDTGDSIMLFEETAPAGTETTFHLHRDSDEVAYVLSGEITFKIGDEVTVGGPGRRMDPKPTKCGAGTAGRSSVRRLFDIRFSQKLSGASDGLRGMNFCRYAGLLTPTPLTSFAILLAPRTAS